MKNMSKVVALILSASAGVWMTGCAAEVADLEETDMALANVDKSAGINKGGLLNEKAEPVSGAISGEIDSPILGKGNLGKGDVGSKLGGQAADEAIQDVENVEDVDSQAAGGDAPLADEAEADQDEAAEGETGESQDALSTQRHWGGRRFGGYGHRGWYGGRHFGYGRGFRGGYGYRHFGGYGGYGYPYGYGYGYDYFPGYSYGVGSLYGWCRAIRFTHPRCARFFW